ncbi:hypothetical protein, partial [Pectobacterium brasiliense]|uniref:hypothetical protein n=1 Tax=Pectobacterium brasiliense TaxID=180957 RepID=UPI0019690984
RNRFQHLFMMIQEIGKHPYPLLSLQRHWRLHFQKDSPLSQKITPCSLHSFLLNSVLSVMVNMSK